MSCENVACQPKYSAATATTMASAGTAAAPRARTSIGVKAKARMKLKASKAGSCVNETPNIQAAAATSAKATPADPNHMGSGPTGPLGAASLDACQASTTLPELKKA